MSKYLKPLIITLVAMIALLVAFQAGRLVGERRAMFSFRWGQNYHQMFGGPQRGLFGDSQDPGFMDAHGIFGRVLKNEGNDLIIQDKDQIEKTVSISTSTLIRKNTDTILLSGVTPNDNVVIIGEPKENGQIEAKFIRILPPLDQGPPPDQGPLLRPMTTNTHP